MLASDFQRRIKRLVPGALFVGAGSSVGLYRKVKEGCVLEHLCGTDYNFVPEFPLWNDNTGAVEKSGWRRVVNLLLLYRWTSPEAVRKVWPEYFHPRNRPLFTPPPNPRNRAYDAMNQLRKRSAEKTGSSDLVGSVDELKGINSMIKKTDAVLESQDRLDFEARKAGIPFT